MRSIESLSLSILRVAEEHAMKENTGQVLVQVPVEIGNYLLNEKRRALSEIEQRHDAPIVIVADDQLETPHYEVTRIRENELGEESNRPSYQRGTPRKLATIALTKANLNVPAAPAVTNVRPAQPAPIREPREEAPVAQAAVATAAPTHSVGVVERILRFFRGAQATPAPKASPARTPETRGRNDRNDRNAQRRDGRKPGARNEQRREEPRGNRPQQGAQQGRPQEAKPRNEPQPKQQKPKQSEPRGEARQPAQAQQAPKAEDSRQAARPPRQPRPEPSTTAESKQPIAEVLNQPSPVVAAVASLPEVAAPTATVAGSDTPAADHEHDPQAAAGESSSRRRRGRRGGRRRRRGGAEGAAGTEGGAQEHDEMAAGDVTAAHRSQPEFDFDDDETAGAMPDMSQAVVGVPPVAAAPVAVAASVAEPVDAVPSPEPIPMEQPEVESNIADAEATATPAPAEPTTQVAFALEPAVVAPAETAVVGLPETAETQREADTSRGLFDTAQVGTVAPVDPVDAAANAVADHADAEPVHGDNERSA
jgi:ribonuclease E